MNKKFLIFAFVILFFGLVQAGSYQISEPWLTHGGEVSAFNTGGNFLDQSVCQGGQDFIVEITSCTPTVVRSDLLEDEDVPVFCELKATKINPFIDVDSIRDINVRAASGNSPIIQTIDYFRNYDALGENERLNNLMKDNIGYAVIVLDRTEVEKDMPEYADVNLTASFTYDLEKSFGLRTHHFYLPVMTDGDFDYNLGQYAFFNNMGYLRADDVQSDSASISIYSGRYESGLFGSTNDAGSVEREKVLNYNLDIGETKGPVYLPGFDCLSGFNMQLDSIDFKDTTAKIRVNSEIFELRADEEFLSGKCRVNSEPEKVGLRQEVEVRCEEDEGAKTFKLRINPSVDLEFDGKIVTKTLGDFLYKSDGKNVYLAYIGYSKKDSKAKDLIVKLVSIPEGPESFTNGKLPEEYLNTAEFYQNAQDRENPTLWNSIKYSSAISEEIYKKYLQSEEYKPIKAGEKMSVSEKEVKFVGFGESSNLDLSYNRTVQNYYDNAVRNYEKVKSNYKNDKYPTNDERVLGEKSLADLIVLAESLQQKSDLKEYCSEFKEKYSKSNFLESVDICSGVPDYANSEISKKTVRINGDFKEISFEGVNQPDYDSYGVQVMVQEKGKEPIPYNMRKGDQYYLNKTAGEYFRLIEINDENEAVFQLSSLKTTGFKGTLEDVQNLISEGKTLTRGITEDFGSRYQFTLTNVNIDRVAKVTIVPVSKLDRSEATFQHKIGIEKRSIQLSTEQTQDLIDKTKRLSETLDSISNSLGGVVEGFKSACLLTGGVLLAKNLVFGAGGDSIARTEAMRGEGGWYKRCDDMVQEDLYDDVDQCFFDNAGKIDDEVSEIKKAMNDQNDRAKEIQDMNGVVIDDPLFGDKVINQTKLMEIKAQDTKSSLEGIEDEFANPDKKDETIDVSKIKSNLNENGLRNEYYNLEELKKIELYSKLSKENPENEAYKKRLYTALTDVKVNIEKKETQVGFANNLGIDPSSINVLNPEESQTENYLGVRVSDLSKNLEGVDDKNFPVAVIQRGRDKYTVVLDDSFETGTFPIKEDDKGLMVFNEDGSRNIPTGDLEKFFTNLNFENRDRSSYSNPMQQSEQVVRYYENEPYKGMPAVVPFDPENGWYAYVKQTLPVMGQIRTYDESGRVSSFYLCNVGKNGLIEKYGSSSDDTCRLFTVGLASNFDQFGGISEDETRALVRDATYAIKDASEQYKGESGNVNILGKTIEIGSPETNLPNAKCVDYMSPTECKILFNACDPVICPSSRCDFGGSYPVTNVVQSGIIGSIALCAPNIKEGIYVPVCLTGIKAGIDSLNSIAKSYQGCLQESLDTGKTVGICDEIHSIYLCEMLWRQGFPLLEVATPKLLGWIFGEGSRGGGEYLGVQAAWENAKSSVNYFTEFYAANAVKAFKARSQDQVGSLVCKNSLSVAYPTGQGFFDTFTQADSPPQFTAKFDEIPFTTVTNPPVSHYKVFYHIYAGDDTAAYYKVYFRGEGSSYYEDASMSRIVANGYIEKGGFKSETIDFTFPQGLRELCVQVNNYEECGFGSVSTDFALNYFKDEYLQSQATSEDITSEKECVSGEANLANLLNLNVQEGVGDVISPEVYNDGIIRVCSTDNPGIGTDPNLGTENQRWVDRGYCGDPNLRCFLDTKSLSQVFEFNVTKQDALKEVTKRTLDDYAKAKGYYTQNEFENQLSNLNEITNPFSKINYIMDLFPKVLQNNQKGHLYLLIGKIYKKLSEENFVPPEPEEGEDPSNLDPDNDGLFGSEDPDPLVPNTVEEAFNDPTTTLFKSPVYEFSEGDLLFNTNICYTFFEGEWHWQDCVDYENYDVSRWVPVKEEVNNPYSIFGIGASDESVELISTLKDKTYREGLDILNYNTIERDGFSGTDLYSSYSDMADLRAKLSGSDEVVTVFYTSLPLSFRYDYGNQIWEISDGSDWYVVDEPLVISAVKPGLSEFDKELIASLEGLNFYEGAYNLFNGKVIDLKYLSPSVTGVAGATFSIYKDMITIYANSYGVDRSLLAAVVKQESNFNPYAVSSTGCVGLMQFCTSTAEQYGDIFGDVKSCTKKCSCGVSCDATSVVDSCGCFVDDGRFSASKSLNAGAKYLGSLLKKYSSYSDKESFALASYNGGSGVVDAAIKKIDEMNAQVNWKSVRSVIDSDLLASVNDKYYNSLSDSGRQNKANEIKNYVEKVLNFKEQYETIFDGSSNDGGKEDPKDPTNPEDPPEEIVKPNLEGQTIPEKIYLIAKYYADTGYNHIRTEGGASSDQNVCASFVSRVMYEAGIREDGFVSGKDPDCARIDAWLDLFKSSDHFEEVKDVNLLQRGDILIFGYEKELTQHMAIFRSLEKNGEVLNEKTVINAYGEPGSTGPAQLQTKEAYDKEGWFFYTAYRYVGPEPEVIDPKLQLYNEAIGEFSKLEGDYSDHEEKVLELRNQELISEEQLKDFQGSWFFSLGEASVEDILLVLEENRLRDFGIPMDDDFL